MRKQQVPHPKTSSPLHPLHFTINTDHTRHTHIDSHEVMRASESASGQVYRAERENMTVNNHNIGEANGAGKHDMHGQEEAHSPKRRQRHNR